MGNEDTKEVIDAGGQAFPIQHQQDDYGNVIMYGNYGMTLRDYFAIHAPNDILSDAEGRYAFADEMLKERVKQK